MLSKRVQSIQVSPSIEMTLLAMELKAQGNHVISLSVGEPDFNTPDSIKTAGIGAIEANKTRYTPVAGTPELIQAIITKFKRDNQLDYDRDEILVSAGAKHSIINAMLALIDEGDEVIIPSPYWVSYPDMTRLVDGIPVIVDTKASNNYKLTASELRRHLSGRTKILMMNSPNNPTGSVYSASELYDIAQVLLEYPRVIVISDDIYEVIQWTGERFYNIVNVEPALKSRTLVVNGLSKSFAMTGWRVGFCAGDRAIIKAMNKLQGQMSGNISSISQAAAVHALSLNPDVLNPFIRQYKQRHDMVLRQLNEIKGISCGPAQGAFYLFVNIEDAMNSLGYDSDLSFCLELLKQKFVSTVPGSAFGMANHLRISYALDSDSLSNALLRINQFINESSS